jgi:drug/metabolite transporter (DMT)-like permease
MAPLYREVHDKLAMVFYRGLCISISFSPALLLVPNADFLNASVHLPAILLAAVLAVVGTWAAINSVNYLAVGVANTLLSALSNLFIVLTSVLLVGEKLSTAQCLLIALILVTVLWLGLGQSRGHLPALYNPRKGLLFSSIFAAFTGSGYLLLGIISRESNPILTSYLWESLIGFCAGSALVGRYLLRSKTQVRKEINPISSRIFLKIFISSAPTGIGTATYALAMANGSIAIASAALNLCMVTTTILAVWMYGERLSRFQWGLLVLISLFVIGLRMGF